MSSLAGYLCFHRDSFPDEKLDQLLSRMTGKLGKPLEERHTCGRSGKSRFGIAAASPQLAIEGSSTFAFGGYLQSYSGERFSPVLTGKGHAAFAAEKWQKEKAAYLERQRGLGFGVRFDSLSDEIAIHTDRFGIHRIYYSWQDGIFLFATEPKALLAYSAANFRPNESVAARHFSMNYRMVLGREETYFSGIHDLKAAGQIKVSERGIATDQYWHPSGANPSFDRADSDYEEEFRALLREAVGRDLQRTKRRLFLVSGGLDSPSIAAQARNLLGEPLECGTATFPGSKEFDESSLSGSFMRKNAGKTIMYELEPAGFLRSYLSALNRFDQPLLAPNFLINFEFLKKAEAAGYDAMFGGGGGDRVLHGCLEYQLYLLADYRAYGRERFEKELEAYCNRVGPSLRYWPSRTETSLSWMEKLVDLGIPGKIRHNPDWISPNSVALSPRLRATAIPAPPIEQRLATYAQSRVMEDIFCQADPVQNTLENIVCGTSEVKAIDPFWTQELVEFGLNLPVHMLLRDGWTKYILRRTAVPELPDEFRWRSDKTGLSVPLNDWFRTRPFREELERVLASPKLASTDILDIGYVQEKLRAHGAGEENCGDLLWKVFAYASWLERWA